MRSRGRTQRRESAAKKGALAIGASRHYTADEKALILKTVEQAQTHCPQRPLAAILADLGLPSATYFRWVERAAAGQLADQVVVPHRTPVRPRRPPEADHPDQRWHTDLMVWWFADRWFWLIDVLDAYSRYLIHCQLLLTARAEDVGLAVQTALDTIPPERRRTGEPEIVYECGGQFISADRIRLCAICARTNSIAAIHS